MSDITGRWNLELKTPIGTLHVEYSFERSDDGAELRGTATSRAETVPLYDIVVAGQSSGTQLVTWSQKVTKPMRLNLDFEVEVDGDALSGHSRAGRLPRSKVTGQRATPEPGE